MPDVITLHVNGRRHELHLDPERSLLSVLRDELDLTGTKRSCGEGVCGACTVLVDGEIARSCVTPVGNVAGKTVLTIEGLAQDGQLHPLQTAFLQAGALQCGYCTPGMIMAGLALLGRHPDPSERDIVQFMDGNICRCGTYPRIVRAIRLAAAALRGG